MKNGQLLGPLAKKDGQQHDEYVQYTDEIEQIGTYMPHVGQVTRITRE